MERSDLKKINELDNEIKELDDFLFVAKKVWKGRVTLQKVISKAYGFFGPTEFNMNTEIKNRVLKVLEDYKQELEIKIENTY